MTVLNPRSRRNTLGTLAVAAGGFTVGGLAMALGLSVTDGGGQGVRVVLQDDQAGSQVAAPTTDPGGAPGAPATDDAPAPTTPSSTSASSAPGHAAARAAAPPTARSAHVAITRRAVQAPRATRTKKPPVVKSSGS